MGGMLGTPKKEDEHGEELQHVDTGDSLKVKQLLDESVVKTMLEKFEEDHYVDSIKIVIMIIACLFAMTAQFYPMPFPKSRPLLGICCSGYFIFSGILQLVVKFMERDAIVITKASDKHKAIRVTTSFPRFQSEYSIKLEFEPKGFALEEKYCVGNFFDADGFYYETGFISTVDTLLQRFLAKKSE